MNHLHFRLLGRKWKSSEWKIGERCHGQRSLHRAFGIYRSTKSKETYILTSGTDVASVLKSYAKDLPDGQKCDEWVVCEFSECLDSSDVLILKPCQLLFVPVSLAYWGILDLIGDSITSKALFTKEDWTEMVQSFGQEVKFSETPISDNVSRLFDKIDEVVGKNWWF